MSEIFHSKLRNISLKSFSAPSNAGESYRLFINAAAWQTRTGAPWRDIPPEFGNWNSIHKRFCRWR
ncbi:transposase, partial [Treponema endosymbiont of Eucomonympha sp.]|uniref:transposase n=1 Tax=Treponema endosymbiont of Eucomonympha sp. TaxID=1580831 RepID=UPI0013969D30